MRDLLFLSIFSPLTLLSLVHPWSGVLAFGWIAFLKPQTMTFPFAAHLPFDLAIATTTALGWSFSRERKVFRFDPTTGLIVALVAVSALSTAFSLTPSGSQAAFVELMKTVAFLLLLRLMLTSRVRLHGFVWLMAFAMAFVALNSGVQFIVASGTHPPAGSPHWANVGEGGPALAMLLAVPLMNYLRLQSRHRWMQIALWGAMVLTAAVALIADAAGGLLGLLVMGGCFWRTSKHRVAGLVVLLVAAIGLLGIAPGLWKERAGTIVTSSADDDGFQLRPHAWHAHVAAALDRPLTGAGPDALRDPAIHARYAPAAEANDDAGVQPGDAQSTYFQVLGELGFAGLLVYLALLANGFWTAHRIGRMTEGRPELDWIGDLGRMIQIALIAFCVAGATVSMAFHVYVLSLLVVLAGLHRMAVAAVGRRRKAAGRGRVPVDTTAIAGIWEKAAADKITRLRAHRRGDDLARDGSAAK